jgi:hypothetical protein
MSDFEKVNIALVTFNAQHDLMLSQYFLRFLGFNASVNPSCYYYFREHMDSKNLDSLLKSPSAEIGENTPVFKFWAGEIFKWLRDIFYQCSFRPVMPIRLKQVEVADFGLRYSHH